MRKGATHVGSSETLLDQIAMRNSVPGIFFSFTESKKELRIKTLSRLSGIESREIRRGSAYLLHWYGVPKRTADAEELPPRPLRKSRRDTPFAFFIFHVRQPPILNRL